jgi:hypothetical protein
MNLDYLGNYVQGPVYNDGDIVIGSDGVAYMCTVDGTTTPPEPWPGTGAAVNVALDAKYWVVSPHTSLVNARPLNGLGTGYVRSTVGEPSVVPTIPLTDTTGILPDNRLTSNVALKNIDNFFVSQTFASSVVSGNYPNLRFYAPTNGLDRKIWNVFNYVTGDFYIESVNDAVTLGVAQYKFGRDGTLVGPAFAGNGVQLTNLNAANLATGTVPLARLGTNAAAANLFLRGDNTWQPVDAFPSGLIVIAVGPCPIGWTRVGWDGYFIRGGPSYAAGGSDTHGHTFTSNAAGGHSHSGGTTDSPEHAHRFGVHGQWISSDNLNGQLNVDGGNSGNMSRGPHQHTVDVNWDADTGAGGAHNHGLNINGVGDHTHTGGTDAASNVPLHVLVSFCQKN